MKIETEQTIDNTYDTYYRETHTVSKCIYHIIFCPKYRRNVLVNGIDKRLKDLLYQLQEEYKYRLIEVEVMPDHCHLLLQCSANQNIHSIVTKIKGYTSKVLRKEFPSLKSRIPTLWTHSKFIASVGSVSLEVVKKYIENQKNK